VVGLLFGPNGVGIYDALVRLSRVSKVVVSLLTSALLPVASRLDERGSATTFQRLGELGLIMLPMFTVPPLAAAAILSPSIMQLWIGAALVPYAFWMGLSFLIPICAQYLAIGSLMFLTRPEVQARLNLLLGLQLLIWVAISIATLDFFAERALILGQVVGNLLVLPWQLEMLRGALKLDRDRFTKAIGTQAAIVLIGSALLWLLAGYIQFDSVLKLCLISGIFCLVTWIAQYFLVLEKRHRAIFRQVGTLMGLAHKSN
jgi:O-antigen/teichoic acid export membrane protein